MPCYQPSKEQEIQNLEKSLKRQERQEQLKFVNLQETIKWHEGLMCAVFTELEKRGICKEVIENAQKETGLFGLKQFWENHKKADEIRLTEEAKKKP